MDKSSTRISNDEGYIVLIRYSQPLEKVLEHTEAHREFLGKHCQSGELLIAGPTNPRTGGVIVATLNDRSTLDALLDQDPYWLAGVIEREVIEFHAKRYAEAIADLVKTD